MKEDSIYQQLGVEKDTVERARSYTYDVGFSFAGETRRIVELVNGELKNEDVLTFYDFDQQAVLLAEDLELLLEKIYSESCAFYLVFIDENYAIKVWTKFEKDIMTHSGRSGHIIPVVIDEAGIKGVVGISSTIGRIDLREQWSELRTESKPSEAVFSSVRNRCVIPLLEKLSLQIAGSSTAELFEQN